MYQPSTKILNTEIKQKTIWSVFWGHPVAKGWLQNRISEIYNACQNISTKPSWMNQTCWIQLPRPKWIYIWNFRIEFKRKWLPKHFLKILANVRKNCQAQLQPASTTTLQEISLSTKVCSTLPSDGWPSSGWWVTILSMVGDHPWQLPPPGVSFVSSVYVPNTKSVAHFLLVDFGGGYFFLLPSSVQY